MFDWSACPALESIPGKVSGAWVFRGTRVPVSAILKNLKHMNLDQLVEDYPSVTREQIEMVLDFLSRPADPVFVASEIGLLEARDSRCRDRSALPASSSALSISILTGAQTPMRVWRASSCHRNPCASCPMKISRTGSGCRWSDMRSEVPFIKAGQD